MEAKNHRYQGPEGNPYLPRPATIIKIHAETPNIKSFRLVLNDEQEMSNFRFEPGQVAQLSLFGVGESTFVINSSPQEREYLQFSIMKVGEVTSAFHDLSVGDQVGLRGPLGNWFPYHDMQGKHIVLIGGGLGLAPLRPLMFHILAQRKDYGNIQLIYGARTPDDLCYIHDLDEWEEQDGVRIVRTIDREFPGWEHRVGFVPAIVAQEAPSPENAVAITCGPPIMIKFVLVELEKLGFAPQQIYTTLERRMKCGLGLCGRCNIGPKYVCIDGPVFSLAQLKELPDEL
jgi:NAD(P)H-flavin reductase